MDALHRSPPETEDERETPAAETLAPASDWQVLLLRYLPQPLGTAHAVKRLAAR
jgi:hypothetical protein